MYRELTNVIKYSEWVCWWGGGWGRGGGCGRGGGGGGVGGVWGWGVGGVGFWLFVFLCFFVGL